MRAHLIAPIITSFALLFPLSVFAADQDSDGIDDSVDLCPKVAEDFDQFEDQDGCPDPDNDQDAVLDVNDKCPNEPEDYDGDNDSDGCPDTEKKLVVAEKKIELREQVQFETGKARILPESYPILIEVADVLKERSSLVIRIEGHTDNVGGTESNQELSEKRALSVRQFLIENGINEDRLVAVGFGDTNPIDDNETEYGRYQNRRVEIHIIKQ